MSWHDEAAPLLERWQRAPHDAALAARLARLAERHNQPEHARTWAIHALRARHPDAIRILARHDVPTLDLPDGDTHVTRYALIDGALQAVATLPIPPDCLPERQPHGVALTVLPDDRLIYVFDPRRHPTPDHPDTRVRVKSGGQAAALAYQDGMLYASVRVSAHGRRKAHCALGTFNLDDARAGWHWETLEKPYDALFIEESGDTLLAVDNFILPKFLFRYALSSSPPEIIERVTLPVHTTYEHVFQGARNPRWTALLSRGVNHGVCSQFIALFPNDTLREEIVIRHNLGRLGGANTSVWHHTAWRDGRHLLIAAHDEGVLELDVEHAALTEARAVRDARYAPRLMSLELRQQGALRSVPFAEPVEGDVVRIVPHPERCFGVLMTPDGALRASALDSARAH